MKPADDAKFIMSSFVLAIYAAFIAAITSGIMEKTLNGWVYFAAFVIVGLAADVVIMIIWRKNDR